MIKSRAYNQCDINYLSFDLGFLKFRLYYELCSKIVFFSYLKRLSIVKEVPDVEA